MNPKAMRAFQELFEAEAATLADELVRRGRFDAVRDLAEIFPTVVFPRALGAQADTREALLAYGSLSFNAIGPRNRHLEAALKRAEGVLDWIADSCHRTALRPGSIGRAIYEAADTEGIPEETADSLVRSMFSAGVDTTASELGFAVHDFAPFPDQWQLVRDDPSLARNAFEETIRLSHRSSASSAPRPLRSPLATPASLRRARCSSSSPAPTTTRSSSRNRTASTSADASPATSATAPARTSALA